MAENRRRVGLRHLGYVDRVARISGGEGYASQIGGEDGFRGCVLLDDRSVKDQRIREGDQLVDSFVGTRQTCSVEKYRCHFSAYGVNLGLCCQLSSKQWFVTEFENKGVARLHVVAAVRKCLDKFGDHACQIRNAQLVLTLCRCIEKGCSLFGVSYRAFGKGVDDEFEERESSSRMVRGRALGDSSFYIDHSVSERANSVTGNDTNGAVGDQLSTVMAASRLCRHDSMLQGVA